MRGTILLVEDNQDDEVLSIRALRKARLANEIVVARTGEEAIERLMAPEAELPQLVLLDLKLPRMDGFAVLDHIRSNERTRPLPVVVLTSSDEERDVARSYEYGANSFVSKPVEFAEFTEAVSRLGMYWMLLNRPSPEIG